MLASAVLFSAMSAIVRGLPGVNPYTMVMTRFVVGALSVSALFAAGAQRLRWVNWPWIIARGVSGGFACVAYYWAIRNIGLSKAVMFSYTYVIFAPIFAVPLLRERVLPRHWLAIGVAVVGIALLSGVQRLSVGKGDLIALLGGLVSGFAVVCVTKCHEGDSSANIFFSQCLFGAAIVAWPTWTNWSLPTPCQWAVLVSIGLLAACGQLTMTYAYKFTGAAYGSLLSLLTPVAAGLIGILHFREQQSAGFFAGALLILLSCCYLSLNPVGRATESEPSVG